MTSEKKEAYALAMQNLRKPWARRWLRKNGHWNLMTIPDKKKYKERKLLAAYRGGITS